MSKFNYNEYDWYCDNCDAHLNNQSGFTGESGSWECEKCGYINSIDSGNVLNDLGHALEYVLCVHCPNCDAHLEELGDEMVCPDCGYRCDKEDCEL